MSTRAAYSTFNRLLALLVGGVLALVVAVNVGVDALGLWGTPSLRGFNASKPQQHLYERLVKAQAVMRLRPTAVILGTSRTRLGLDPRELASYTGGPAYSLAMGNSHIVEQASYLRHALFNQPRLREVLVAVDYQAFTHLDAAGLEQLGYSTARLERDRLPLADYAAHTLTWTALVDSWATVLANRNAPDSMPLGPEGQDLALPWRAPLEASGPVSAFDWYLRLVQSPEGPRYAYEPGTMAAMAEIVAMCRARHVHLTVVTSPVHAIEFESLWVRDHGQGLARWERDLAKTTEFWEFGGFNPITTRPVDARVGYVDPAHYRPAIGNELLARVYAPGKAKAIPGFGVRVDARSIDAHLQALQAERAAWLASDPALAARLHVGALQPPPGASP